MKKLLSLLLTALLLFVLIIPAAGDSEIDISVNDSLTETAEETIDQQILEELNEPTEGYEEFYVDVPGDDYMIPAIIGMPEEEPLCAVIMLHGTGSTKNEAGDGYKIAAPILGETYKIATIRIDFPGYGDSEADDRLYDFASAVSCAEHARLFMNQEYGIENFAVMGWSQGGTDALLAAGNDPQGWMSVVTWAGAPDLSDMLTDEDYEEAKANGYFEMEYEFRGPSRVSLQWCEDVKNTDVLDVFSAFRGPVLAIYGTEDTTVDPAWSDKIVEASPNEASRTYSIEGMDHTFNVFAEEDFHSLLDAVDATGAFLQDTLQ